MWQFASPWPVTGRCGSNCILSPCLWLYLLEQYLYLKIWTTVQNIRRCFHIEFWILVGLLADIMAVVPDGLYYADLVENIFGLLASLRSSIRNAISSCQSTESKSPSSQISTFSALVSPFSLLIADSLEKNDWTCPFHKPFVSGTFLKYPCFWSFSCPLRPQRDLVSCLFVYQHQIVRWGKTWLSR